MGSISNFILNDEQAFSGANNMNSYLTPVSTLVSPSPTEILSGKMEQNLDSGCLQSSASPDCQQNDNITSEQSNALQLSSSSS